MDNYRTLELKESLFLPLNKYCEENNIKLLYFNNKFLKKKKIYGGDCRVSGKLKLEGRPTICICPCFTRPEYSGFLKINRFKWYFWNEAGVYHFRELF